MFGDFEKLKVDPKKEKEQKTMGGLNYLNQLCNPPPQEKPKVVDPIASSFMPMPIKPKQGSRTESNPLRSIKSLEPGLNPIKPLGESMPKEAVKATPEPKPSTMGGFLMP